MIRKTKSCVHSRYVALASVTMKQVSVTMKG